MKKNYLLLWEFFYNFYKENIDEIESELKENGIDPEKSRQKLLEFLDRYYATLEYKKGQKLQHEAENFLSNLSGTDLEIMNINYMVAAKKGNEKNAELDEEEKQLLEFLKNKKNSSK